jgi:glycosyltransferase involved in cell wall biosynthesis
MVICTTLPTNLADGLHLRVYHLCRELASSNECFFVGPVPVEMEEVDFSTYGFSDSRVLEPRPKSGRSWRRHFRLSNENFLAMSSPEYFAKARSVVREAAVTWSADVVICFAPALSELGLQAGIPNVLDFVDSRSLTAERANKNRGQERGFAGTIASALKSRRDAARERFLVRSYDLTTTISEPDRKALLRDSGVGGDKVVVLPNGVSEAALTTDGSEQGHDRSIIFWGNLDFPPNWTAVEYFFDEIYLPFLADRDIDWHIVGGGASEQLLGKVRHPRVHFHGFVDDLFGFASGRGAMINPMVEGSGLKNKVLEALALNLPVVSTRMGIEAIDGDENRHFLVADSPADFADCIERVMDNVQLRESIVVAGRELVQSHYTWKVVGRRFDEIIQQLLHVPTERAAG